MITYILKILTMYSSVFYWWPHDLQQYDSDVNPMFDTIIVAYGHEWMKVLE